jgi:hypothetical protein
MKEKGTIVAKEAGGETLDTCSREWNYIMNVECVQSGDGS